MLSLLKSSSHLWKALFRSLNYDPDLNSECYKPRFRCFTTINFEKTRAKYDTYCFLSQWVKIYKILFLLEFYPISIQGSSKEHIEPKSTDFFLKPKLKELAVFLSRKVSEKWRWCFPILEPRKFE